MTEAERAAICTLFEPDVIADRGRTD